MKSQNKNLSYLILLLALSLLLLIFFIWPIASQLDATYQKTLAESGLLREKSSQQGNLAATERQLEAASAVLDRTQKIFILPGQEIEFINKLDSLAVKYRVQAAITPDFNGPALTSDIKQLLLGIKAEGESKNLIAYLQGLESLPEIFSINQLTLTKDDSGTTTFALAISGQAYLLASSTK